MEQVRPSSKVLKELILFQNSLSIYDERYNFYKLTVNPTSAEPFGTFVITYQSLSSSLGEYQLSKAKCSYRFFLDDWQYLVMFCSAQPLTLLTLTRQFGVEDNVLV